MDQPLDHRGPVDALAHVAGAQHLAALLACHQVLDIGEGRARFGQAADHLVGHGALADARGVLQAAEDQVGAALVVVDIGLLFFRMNI